MPLRAFALATVVAGGIVGSPRAGHAAADEFDDPKLSREGLAPSAHVSPPPPPEPAVTPSADKSAADKAASDKIAAEKAAAEKAAADKLAAEKPAPAKPVEKTTPEKLEADHVIKAPSAPTNEKSASEKPAAAKAASDKPATGDKEGIDAKPAAPVHAASSPPAGGAADLKAVASPPAAAPESRWPGPWPYVPRLKLAYRRFPFSRIAAVTADGVMTSPVSESFESLSIDTYPMSSYLRVGLSTQFGWESGQFHRTGDYFLAESASVGFQIPGRYTPFVETLAGAGYMRRRQADSNLPTAYWQVGIDLGVELYFAKRAYGSIAIGYLHPANLFFAQRNLQSVNLDTWSLKVGIGI